jgi:hypothetical protein
MTVARREIEVGVGERLVAEEELLDVPPEPVVEAVSEA